MGTAMMDIMMLQLARLVKGHGFLPRSGAWGLVDLHARRFGAANPGLEPIMGRLFRRSSLASAFWHYFCYKLPIRGTSIPTARYDGADGKTAPERARQSEPLKE